MILLSTRNIMRLTAHQLAIIADTLTHSLAVSNWGGYYTVQSRERVRNLIDAIIDSMSVEVITDKASMSQAAKKPEFPPPRVIREDSLPGKQTR